MKLTFKDLKQQKFVIEAEPSELISDVKAKITEEKGWEADKQKLIYSGKILQDDKTVESYSIEEKGFIVCMVTKPKAAPAASSSKAAPSTPAPITASTPAAPAPAASSGSTTNAPETPTPAPAAGGSEGTRFNDPSALAMGNERNAAIANMESMGFPRTDIDRAMRAAFNNPDRAVEYLLSGIPENLLREETQQPPARQAGRAAAPAAATGGDTAAAAAPTTGDEPVNLFEAAAQAGQGRGGAGRAGGAGAGAGAGGAGAGGPGLGALGNLDFLRNNPQFQQLRQVVHQQPQMLEPILQQVAAGNPMLAQLITSQPEQFMELLSEELDEGENPMPPGVQSVSVTVEEREAIDRLCLLGFERDAVIQAYFACDKDEEVAANFLFEHEGADGDGQ